MTGMNLLQAAGPAGRYLFLAGVVLFIIAAILCMRVKRILNRLEKMLEEASVGAFDEKHFDESRLSRLESGFVRFFNNSSLAGKNVKKEEERIKRLIGDISHQTKTPISNIFLYSQLLLEEDLTEETRRLVERIEGQSEKLRFLIDALVKISRLENGVLHVVPRYENVGDLINETVRNVEKRSREKNITISLSLPAEELYAYFDPKWTQEAVFNVLDNAVKYTPPGGRIQMKAVAYELFVRLDIKDNGIGIPEEEQANIFRRFYRSERVSQEEGVGVGLYLARQILRREDGYIKVGQNEEGGSCFSLFLPSAPKKTLMENKHPLPL